MKKNKMQVAIDRIADLIPNGHLLSVTGGYDFLDAVACELERLNKVIKDGSYNVPQRKDGGEG